MTYELIIERLSLRPSGICLREPDEATVYRRRDDLLWKAVLEDLFGDFLRFFFSRSVDSFDFTRGFQYLDKDFDRLFASGGGSKSLRHVDKLVKVFLRDGSESYFFVHVEVQGQKGREDLAERMFRYWYRVKDKYRGVPVTALAILTDTVKSFHPHVYQEQWLGTGLTYSFNTYKILDQNEAALRADDNPFALVILASLQALKNRKAGDEPLLHVKRELLREMLARDLDAPRRTGIFNFINYTLHLKQEASRNLFEQDINQLTERSTSMGTEEFLLEEARKEGRLKEKGQIVKNLIEQMGLSDQQAAKVAEVSVAFVREIRRQLKR